MEVNKGIWEMVVKPQGESFYTCIFNTHSHLILASVKDGNFL